MKLVFILFLFTIRFFTDINLRCLKSITSLNLSHNNMINNCGIIHLQNLKCLNLAYNPNITNDAFTFLTNLTSLDLSGIQRMSEMHGNEILIF